MSAQPASAQAPDSEDLAFMVAKGRVTYRVYCINCHGAKALGDGTLAELLTVQPANLTELAAKNDGTFPAERVEISIDGRVKVRGHGLQEMPVWGDVFQTSSVTASGQDADGESRAKRKIAELVAYLASIQATD